MNEPELLRDFACSHGEPGEMKTLREEVCAALECTRDQLVTAVIQDLYWRYNVQITGIPTDMWSAVKSEYHRHVTEEEWEALPEDASTADEWVVVAKAYVECDLIEDGFALTWKTWKQWFEERA